MILEKIPAAHLLTYKIFPVGIYYNSQGNTQEAPMGDLPKTYPAFMNINVYFLNLVCSFCLKKEGANYFKSEPLYFGCLTEEL